MHLQHTGSKYAAEAAASLLASVDDVQILSDKKAPRRVTVTILETRTGQVRSWYFFSFGTRTRSLAIKCMAESSRPSLFQDSITQILNNSMDNVENLSQWCPAAAAGESVGMSRYT